MQTLHVLLANFKTALVFLGGLAVIWFMSRNLMISLNEQAPTAINMDRWNTEYHGQQWLKLTGIARPDLKGTTSKAFIPVVGGDFQPGDPIHAVIISNLAGMEKYAGPVTVTGLLAPPHAWDLDRVMPGNHFAADVVCLNEDTEPDGVGASIAFISLGVFVAALAGYRLARAIKELRTPPEPLPLWSPEATA